MNKLDLLKIKLQYKEYADEYINILGKDANQVLYTESSLIGTIIQEYFDKDCKSAIFLGMDKNFHLNFKYVFLLPKFKFHKNVLMHVHTSNVKCIFYYDKYIQLNIPSLHTISLNVDINT